MIINLNLHKPYKLKDNWLILENLLIKFMIKNLDKFFKIKILVNLIDKLIIQRDKLWPMVVD